MSDDRESVDMVDVSVHHTAAAEMCRPVCLRWLEYGMQAEC